jgi:hypothetical protein
MKIANAQLELASRHVSVARREVSESLKIEIGPSLANTADEARSAEETPSSLVRLSDAARQKLDADTTARTANKLDDPVKNDPHLSMMRAAIEMLTGRKIQISDVELRDPAEADAYYALEYERHESWFEAETTEFSAQGKVLTSDGREINFELNLSMSRSFYEESHFSVRMGNVKDPLVLNFAGTAAELSDAKFRFDLDADGEQDDIHALKPGSGFLVFDRNQDGKVNDGRELFGALTGDGFGELAALDEDGNGWIDENDSAWTRLYVWEKDAAGQDRLRSLKDANVGAISLAHVNTPFSIKDQNTHQLQGEIRATGVFLQETGGVGTIQKIDLAV